MFPTLLHLKEKTKSLPSSPKFIWFFFFSSTYIHPLHPSATMKDDRQGSTGRPAVRGSMAARRFPSPSLGVGRQGSFRWTSLGCPYEIHQGYFRHRKHLTQLQTKIPVLPVLRIPPKSLSQHTWLFCISWLKFTVA